MKLKNDSNKKTKVLSWILPLIVLLILTGNFSMAQTAAIDKYAKPSIYSLSTDFTLKANGQTVDVIQFQDYDYVHFSMGPGSCTFEVTVLGQSSISSYAINPLNLNIPGSVSGNKLIPVSQGARISAPEAERQTLEGKAKINLELFPNPAEGSLNIASSEDLSGAVVTIINSLGIKELSVSDINSQSLNISILRPGIYTLVITKNGHRASRRFIKSK